MKVLSVHGVGKHSPNDQTWQDEWRDAVQNALGASVNVEFCLHDDLFVDSGLTWSETITAIEQLGGSALNSWIRSRGLFDGDNVIGWTAGMVTQWAGTPELRQKTRDRLYNQIKTFQPDILLAHSLGSLIGYDLFTQIPAAISGKIFISFGSQINNSFVRGIFEGGVRPLPPEAFWVHLYNANDWMFTESFGRDMDDVENFRQFLVPFQEGLIGSHTDIKRYLNDPKANAAWPVIKDWFHAAPATGRSRSLPACLQPQFRRQWHRPNATNEEHYL